MIAVGFFGGERIDRIIALGWLLAVAGLVLLLLPGVSAPPPLQAAFMLIAGIAWGMYSLHGRSSTDALGDTAGNFVRAVPGTLVVSLLFLRTVPPTRSAYCWRRCRGRSPPVSATPPGTPRCRGWGRLPPPTRS